MDNDDTSRDRGAPGARSGAPFAGSVSVALDRTLLCQGGVVERAVRMLEFASLVVATTLMSGFSRLQIKPANLLPQVFDEDDEEDNLQTVRPWKHTLNFRPRTRCGDAHCKATLHPPCALALHSAAGKDN